MPSCRWCTREPRAQAARYLNKERRDHRLQPTALVHEAYLRLVGQQRVSWQNRAHFFGLAAQMMRRILVDHARKHQAAKRPTAALKVAWAERVGASEQSRDCELLLLDQALCELAASYPRQGQIVELRGLRRPFRTGSGRCPRRLAHDCESGVEERESVAVPAHDAGTN